MEYVTYFRVSTQKQGQSKLGLEAQRAILTDYISKTKGREIAEFVDVETGKNNNRAGLNAAIQRAKETGATLLVAKLDRLSRNAAFLLQLKDAGVSFVCCDNPDLNTLTLGIFASIAQHERELISTRTKAALAAKKARGEKLGLTAKVNFTNETRKKGNEALRLKAAQNPNNQRAKAVAVKLFSEGKGLAEITRWLNEAGFLTARGKTFQIVQVQRLLKCS